MVQPRSRLVKKTEIVVGTFLPFGHVVLISRFVDIDISAFKTDLYPLEKHPLKSVREPIQMRIKIAARNAQEHHREPWIQLGPLLGGAPSDQTTCLGSETVRLPTSLSMFFSRGPIVLKDAVLHGVVLERQLWLKRLIDGVSSLLQPYLLRLIRMSMVGAQDAIRPLGALRNVLLDWTVLHRVSIRQ
ncbi:hypothetical protein BD309DRAFT_570570 [Dichomitus squalens]|nr:hypothetical protein BD309DRAFT_570570 [Dichomitus squalens]